MGLQNSRFIELNLLEASFEFDNLKSRLMLLLIYVLVLPVKRFFFKFKILYEVSFNPVDFKSKWT